MATSKQPWKSHMAIGTLLFGTAWAEGHLHIPQLTVPNVITIKGECTNPYYLIWHCQTPFTWYNRQYRVNKHPTGRQTAVVCSTGCQTRLYNQFDNRLYTQYSRLSTGLTTGWMFVYKHSTGCQTVWQQVVSCKRGLSITTMNIFLITCKIIINVSSSTVWIIEQQANLTENTKYGEIFVFCAHFGCFVKFDSETPIYKPREFANHICWYISSAPSAAQAATAINTVERRTYNTASWLSLKDEFSSPWQRSHISLTTDSRLRTSASYLDEPSSCACWQLPVQHRLINTRQRLNV